MSNEPASQVPRAVAKIPEGVPPTEGPVYEDPKFEDPKFEGKVQYQALAGLQPLYSTKQIRVATFLAGPLTATWLLALNFKHLRQPHLLRRTLLLGLLASAAYCAVVFALPDNFPMLPVWLGTMFIAGKIAEAAQGKSLDRHEELGGKRSSNWKVAGVCTMAGLITGAALVATQWQSFQSIFPNSVSFGDENEVYYEKGATKAEARELGEALKKVGYFTSDQPASVVLLRPEGSYTVRFMALESAFTDKESIDYFREIEFHLEAELHRPITGELAADYDDVRMALKPWVPPACDDDHPSLCHDLAFDYFAGAETVAQDFVLAASTFKQACEGQMQDSCAMLGHLHLEGLGVDEDEVEAKRLFTKACDLDTMRGCAMLADALSQNSRDGEAKDAAILAEILRLRQKACEGKWTNSCVQLGEMYAEGDGVETDLEKARSLMEGACDDGNAIGCSRLGTIYSEGYGVEVDLDKSRSLFQRACEGGLESACAEEK